jgi:XTP/dITP diphosphohydrolase
MPSLMPGEIVLATRSAGKIRELVEIILAAAFVPRTLDELGIAETDDEAGIEAFETFEENALAKARYFLPRAGGRTVLADDSGLSVESLGGAPGVRSKRWAAAPGLGGLALDAANNARLVRELASVTDRAARYVCAAALVNADTEIVVRGECRGVIVDVPRGAHGFGYDPHFLSDELGATFGEASLGAKERISHRGRAVRGALERFARKSSHGR